MPMLLASAGGDAGAGTVLELLQLYFYCILAHDTGYSVLVYTAFNRLGLHRVSCTATPDDRRYVPGPALPNGTGTRGAGRSCYLYSCLYVVTRTAVASRVQLYVQL